MKFVLFYHSALSDWNHGNAHFLRGIAVELQSRGHRVTIFEPADSWSATSLVADHGRAALAATARAYPTLEVQQYRDPLDLDAVLDHADVVVVHEWNPHDLVRRIGEHRRGSRYTLLFHDTHHRSVSDARSMAAYDLSHYDGVLAFGEVIRQRYLELGWARRVWTWHEAADTRVFHPRPRVRRARDLVWIGNWGDDERSAELREFLIEPAQALRLRTTVHGVRFPPEALQALEAAGLLYQGWLPNYRVPEVFARHRVTVHIPRRPYVTTLRGIPTIRPFEALACGIPLVSAPWPDEEHLFRPGEDYLVARNGSEMRQHLRDVLNDADLSAALAASGLETIRARHTCAHRVDELLGVVDSLTDGVAEAERVVTL
jgi:spore maturation protein CgeB